MHSVWTGSKANCFGCEACLQVCRQAAIHMEEDEEGFRYPIIDQTKCMNCGLCQKVCPKLCHVEKNTTQHYVFGGYHMNPAVRDASTSGGAFTAIVENWCDDNYVIFGAQAERLEVSHTYITDKANLNLFRKSKYGQSKLGLAYKQANMYLKQGKKVVFTGTPCQIAAFMNCLERDTPQNTLLTIEVVCEGYPSPLFIRKYVTFLENKYKKKVVSIDYRFKDRLKWDFEVMLVSFSDGSTRKIDRWFNPFWIFWADRLMSRPSCVECPFRTPDRVADITLGDLWGVHKYCPELYGNNGGSSLVVCNSPQGRQALERAKKNLFGHELAYETALQYQRPMRVKVPANKNRDLFVRDLQEMDYSELCKKYKPRESLKVLFSKYVWGSNHQKVFFWRLRNRLKELTGK